MRQLAWVLTIAVVGVSCRKTPRPHHTPVASAPDPGRHGPDAGLPTLSWGRGGAVVPGCRGGDAGWPAEEMPRGTLVHYSDRGGLSSWGVRVGEGGELDVLQKNGEAWSRQRVIGSAEMVELRAAIQDARLPGLFPGYDPTEDHFDHGLVHLQLPEDGTVRAMVMDSGCIPPEVLPLVQLLVRLKEQ